MFEKYLVRHCSPTLASIKTANLFAYYYDSEEELELQIKTWNNCLNKRGVNLYLLKNKNKTALIYVCREKMLNDDLSKKQVQEFLFQCGYNDFKINNVLETLKEKILSSEVFPHEIGIFLGYPLEDVIGFIENKGENCKLVGCWKVYCNECEMLRKFTNYKKCTNIYTKLWNEGRSIVQLTVAA